MSVPRGQCTRIPVNRERVPHQDNFKQFHQLDASCRLEGVTDFTTDVPGKISVDFAKNVQIFEQRAVLRRREGEVLHLAVLAQRLSAHHRRR